MTAALIGGSISAISTGILIELGGLSIEIAKKMEAIKNFRNNHELAYIIEAEKKIAKKS